jgi:hypothetical protein
MGRQAGSGSDRVGGICYHDVTGLQFAEYFRLSADSDAGFDIYPLRLALSHTNHESSLKVGRNGSGWNQHRWIGPLNRPFDGSKTSWGDLRVGVLHVQFDRHGPGILRDIMSNAGNWSVKCLVYVA